MTRNAMEEQIGGSHYKGGGIQPFELSAANGHDGCIHAIQKYLTRHHLKAGKMDLQKAIHICSIRVDTMSRYGVPTYMGPNDGDNRIDINRYIETNELRDPEAKVITLVEFWHKMPTLGPVFHGESDNVCQTIQNMIHELIDLRYPTGKESE